MSTHALPLWRPAVAVLWTGLAAAVLATGACAEREPLSSAAGGNLFAHGLDAISELYIEPVSAERLALAGAAELARLDQRLSLSSGSATHVVDALGIDYDGREIASYAAPAATDSRRWGEILAGMVAAASRTSPRLAALSAEKVDTAVLDGMTMPLDRFSHYSPPDLARDQRAARDGFGGTGIMLDASEDTFRITAVTPHSPAERAGIRPEDRILAINGIGTGGHSPRELIRQLRGPIGSAVDLQVSRQGMAAPRDVRLRRAYVVPPTVTMARDGDIALFRIAGFNQGTTERIATRLSEAEREPAGRPAGVVLDLRDNPGGLLDQAVSLVDLFIKSGPIVSTVGRHPASYQHFAAAGDSIAPVVPLVVLINGSSASAAEIVAAALQDSGRAVVVGSSSYGKGSVQTVTRLPNNGELTVTWAELVAPAGYPLQKHGVVPTVCTAGLADDAAGLAAGLQQAAAGAASAGPPVPPRARLDERQWSELRRACPPRHARPAVDVQVAEHLLADPKLYRAALHALPAATQLAQTPAAPALTETGRALSSH